jgi:hypothetical protein
MTFEPHDPVDGGFMSALQIGSSLQSEFKAVRRRRGEKPDPALQGKFDPKAA